MKLIDTHIHLDFDQFDAGRSLLIQQASELGVAAFIVPATVRQRWPIIAALCEQKNCFAAYGLHPYFIAEHHENDLSKLERWISTHSPLAVGEIGLDFFLTELDQARQIQFFNAQLDIAEQQHLPVILHARKAVEAIILILKNRSVVGGIVHSYNGSLQQAHRLIDLGFKLGFGGAITYPRATRLQALIRSLPLHSIVLETDAPDQPPIRLSKQGNNPIALLDIYHAVCALRDESSATIAAQTTSNTMEVFPTLSQI